MYKSSASILIVIFFIFLFGCKSISIIQKPKASKTIKHVYLVIGQSNTAGRAAIEPQDTLSLNGVYLFNNGGKWERAKNPLNKYSNIRKRLGMQRLGYAYTFGRTLNRLTGQNIGLVVNARGGTNINQWLKDAPDAYFDSAYVRLKEALQLPNTELKGILWHQGEGDKRRTASYLEKLEQLVTDLRNKLDRPDLPLVAGQISHIRPENAKFNEMILTLPNTIANTYVVKSDDLHTADSTHFDSEGQRLLGNRYATKVFEEIYEQTEVESKIRKTKN